MGIVETCHTHKFYRHLFFWIIYFFPFETSATASWGFTGILYLEANDVPVLHVSEARGWTLAIDLVELWGRIWHLKNAVSRMDWAIFGEKFWFHLLLDFWDTHGHV